MTPIVALALKDLRLLARNRAALFFALVWPLIVAILFGVVFSGGGGASGKPRVAIADLDHSPGSAAFLSELRAIEELETDVMAEASARDLVRQGKRVAAIVIPAGYGAASKRVFHGDPPTVELLLDPSRKAEQAMVAGMLQRTAGQRLSRQLTDASQAQEWIGQAHADLAQLPPEQRASIAEFLDSTERMLKQQPPAASPAGNAASGGWQPLAITTTPVARASDGPPSGFAITFPQGLLWALVGCLMSFAASLVSERTEGTYLRLRASPMSALEVLLGKGLACLLAMLALAALLFAVAIAFFHVRPVMPGLLLLAVLVSAFAFTGIMMLIASIGRTTQAVSGAGWALMMPMMLLGGGMMPSFVMPAWMQSAGVISPVRWAMRSVEGALWRGFSLEDMAPGLGVLAAVGTLALAVGVWRFRRAELA